MKDGTKAVENSIQYCFNINDMKLRVCKLNIVSVSNTVVANAIRKQELSVGFVKIGYRGWPSIKITDKVNH